MSSLLDRDIEQKNIFNKKEGLDVSAEELRKARDARALAASRKMSSTADSAKQVALTKESGGAMPAPGGMSKAGAAQAGVSALQAAGVGGEGAGGAESAAMGAASGALAGAAMGPVGAGVGAVVGGTVGLLKARSARKQRAREAQAKMHANIAAIETQKSGRIAGALENIRAGFQSSLIRNTPGIRF